MSKELIRQIKLLRQERSHINPDPQWVVRSREQLFSQIKNSIGTDPEPASFVHAIESFLKFFISPKIYYTMRVAFVFALAISITVGGWIGGASASQSCLPGDFCYSVKLAAEKTQAAVASVVSGNDKQVALHLEFAARRMDEIRQSNNSHKAEAVKELKKNLESVSNSLKEAKKDDLLKAAQVAKDVTRTTSDIVRTLNDVVTGNEGIGSIAAAKEIADTTKVVNDTGIEAIQVALEGQAAGLVKNDDIKALVQEKINIIVDDTKGTQATAHEVKELVDSNASSTVVTTNPLPLIVETAKDLDDVSVSTSTDPGATSTTSSPAIEVNKMVASADAMVTTVENVAEEAKVLLEGNKVEEAVEKMKTLNILSTEAKQKVVEAQDAAQNPIFIPSEAVETNIVTTTNQ